MRPDLAPLKPSRITGRSFLRGLLFMCLWGAALAIVEIILEGVLGRSPVPSWISRPVWIAIGVPICMKSMMVPIDESKPKPSADPLA